MIIYRPPGSKKGSWGAALREAKTLVQFLEDPEKYAAFVAEFGDHAVTGIEPEDEKREYLIDVYLSGADVLEARVVGGSLRITCAAKEPE